VSEFTRERLNYLPLKDWFSDLPEPRVTMQQRRSRDPYFTAIQQNILRLKHHIRTIQEEEYELLTRYCKHLENEANAENKPRDKDSERARLNFLEQLAQVRKSRKQYRALLFDAITQRNNMIEAAEIRADEAKAVDAQLWSLGRHKEVDYFLFFVFALQLLAMLLIIIFFEFNVTTNSELRKNAFVTPVAGRGGPAASPYQYYIDSALMLFAGFGFLGTFVKKYQFSGLAYGFLIAAFAMQWVIVWTGFFQQESDPAPLQRTFLSIPHLQTAVYGATAVAISCGAVLGRLDPLQLALMAVAETFFFALNLFVCESLSEGYKDGNVTGRWYEDFYAQFQGRVDPGGGMLVHMFGCYFGLALSWWFRPAKTESADQRDDRDEKTDYPSNMYAFFGTALLFVLFPSFNAAFAYSSNGGQQRVIANTVFALVASIVGAFATSKCAIQSGNKFGPLEIHHATLAGGVAIASTSIYFLPAAAAMTIGFIVGVLSTACYLYLTPALKRFMRLADTAGVHSLHGVPALVGAFVSTIVVAIADSIFESTEARNAELSDSVTELNSNINGTVSIGYTYSIKPVDLWYTDGSEHAVNHLFVLLVTFFLALIAGCLTGGFIKFFAWVTKTGVPEEDQYQDKTTFHVPEDYVGE